MNEAQIEALKKWLDAQTYGTAPGTFGPYLDADEMKQYLPDAINKILKEVK